jgi:ankyrin repeat protein
MVLKHGADVNTRDKRHRTALHRAIKTHSLVVIEALIRHGADVNVSDFQGITPLTLAVKEKDCTAVEALLAHNPNVDAQDEDGYTALYHEISSPYRPDNDIVDLLLRRGADASIRNNNNKTLLAASIGTGLGVVDVDLLLKYGADVNASDSSGRTALHEVIRRWNLIVTSLQNDVRLNASSDWGGTSAFLAFSQGQIDMVEALLEHDANVNAVDRWNTTALRIAVEIANVTLIKMLLVYGADAYSQIRGEPSIMEIALRKHDETITRLLTYFADVPPRTRSEAARLLEQQAWWKNHLLRDTVL